MAGPEGEIDALRAQIAALTARVYQLEQKLGDGSAEGRPREIPQQPPASTSFAAATPAASAPANAMPGAPSSGRATGARALTDRLRHSSATRGDFETKIGQYWLNRIGIVAMLIGVSYFLKFAFDNNWIGASGRIAIGLVAGVALILWGERFRRRGYKSFSYSLKAVGIGTLYLSLWGAFQLYQLIPAGVAFVAMAAVTAATIVMALAEDAELLASFALAGGFSTPLLLSTGENHEVALFLYVCLLDLAILALAIRKPWRRLLWGSFLGTATLYAGWNSQYYSKDQRPVTILFLSAFAAIFAAIPLMTRYARSTRFPGPSTTLTLLPLLNAGGFFLALYDMYRLETDVLTWYALALAAAYLAISAVFRRRFPDQETQFINLLHVAIGIAFVTIAIPLKLEAHWITIGWIIESAVLLWVSVRMHGSFLRYLAISALALGIGRLLFYDNFHTDTLIFNMRFVTYLVAIAVLGGIVAFGKRYASPREMLFLQFALVALNALALIALTSEASAYFDHQVELSGRRLGYASTYAQLQLAREFSYSAVWLIYGAVLMAIGFWRRSALVRWQALVLIAVTIAKVFVWDVSALDKGYRILSFVALGAVLLAISFVYQRDWLKLFHAPKERAEETS